MLPLSPDRDRRSLRSPGRLPPPMRSSRPMSSGGYKVLCVSDLHPKASDDVIRDTLYREYKKYGDISVRVVQEPDERVAYVYFRNFEDARDAKHSKSRIILFDKVALVEPVYERGSSDSYMRRRSMSPPGPYPPHQRYRSRSPVYDGRDRYHRDYRNDYHHHHHSPREYIPREPYHGGGRGRGHYHHPRDGGYHSRGGYHGERRGGMHGGPPMSRMDSKMKDKFPNFLNHVTPEDDPDATRTLFVGNLELNITDEEMKRIFGEYGRLVDIDIKRPPPGTGNAYAFLRYENLDQAHKAKVTLSGQYIGKFQCKIGYGKVNATPKVWIGGLGSWASVADLEREFDRFGAIQKVEYRKGDKHAIIFYETLEAAQAAVAKMRGFPLGGPDKRIRIDYADVEVDGAAPVPTPSSSYSRGREPDYDHYERGRGRGRYPYRGRGGGGYGHSHGHGHGHDDWSKRPSYHDEDRMPRGGRMEPMDDDRDFSPPPDDRRLSGAKTVSEICRAAPKAWEGGLILKNSSFPTKFHLVEGDLRTAEGLKDESGEPNLKITQRLRLDQSKLDDLNRRMSSSGTHAVFLGVSSPMAVPTNSDSNPDIQSRPLRNLISYLKQKEAAGVISMSNDMDFSGVLYCFPPCAFSFELLKREAPYLVSEEAKDDHLVILVVAGTNT